MWAFKLQIYYAYQQRNFALYWCQLVSVQDINAAAPCSTKPPFHNEYLYINYLNNGVQLYHNYNKEHQLLCCLDTVSYTDLLTIYVLAMANLGLPFKLEGSAKCHSHSYIHLTTCKSCWELFWWWWWWWCGGGSVVWCQNVNTFSCMAILYQKSWSWGCRSMLWFGVWCKSKVIFVLNVIVY